MTDCIQFDLPWICALLAKHNLRPITYDSEGEWVRCCSLDDLVLGDAKLMPTSNQSKCNDALKVLGEYVIPQKKKEMDLHDPEQDAVNILLRMHAMDRKMRSRTYY